MKKSARLDFGLLFLIVFLGGLVIGHSSENSFLVWSILTGCAMAVVAFVKVSLLFEEGS